MSDLSLKNVKKAFGSVEVIRGVNLDIKSGEFIVFVGPSGCGKSTLLRMIAGLESITDGEVSIGGSVVNDVPAPQRGIAMVFQSYALYPHMSVRDNLGFGLSLKKTPKDDINRQVERAAEILQLGPYLDRMPKALSGGQRQRVAIGRAIVREPQIFLFDEPLSNLDASLRTATRIEIATLHTALGNTMIYVTHDQTEAMTLADRIVVLRAGNIEQVGSPTELYDHPANLFVAQFIGGQEMNVLDITPSDQGVQLSSGMTIPTSNAAQISKVGVRPEHLEQVSSGEGPFQITIKILERLGEFTLAHGEMPDGAKISAKLPNSEDLEIGASISLRHQSGRLYFFDADGQALPA